MVRPTNAEIDLSAITHNVARLAEVIRPGMLCAVVKADAYGHGDVPVAEAAVEAGATWLAVALVEEGIRLREGGIDAPILVLSEPGPDAAVDVVKWKLTPTVYSQGFVEALDSTGARLGVHIKVDTGMHRVGAAPRLIHDLVSAVRSSSRLAVDGLWTHFSVADEDPEFTRHQIEVFDAAVAGIEAHLVHLANTPGAILFPEARRDMCRIGIGLYGLHPCEATKPLVELRPAMRVVSQVTHVQRLEAGARPSYGRIREVSGDSLVATVPVGYADGFSRALSERASVLIHGRRFPLAGRVTMDQIVVELGGEEVERGDEVVLLGTQGDEEITADEWAGMMGTINYEVVCSIGPRVPRRYLS